MTSDGPRRTTVFGDRVRPYLAAIRRTIRRRHLPAETRQLLIDELSGTVTSAARGLTRKTVRVDHDRTDVPPPPFPIDAVVTWVDHADPEWQREFEVTLASEQASAHRDDAAYHSARFENHDEIRYALRSLWQYAGWFRRVVLVTAGQTPSWLDSHDRIRLITHQELLPSAALPTFNSHAIEATLHRIPDLSEHFVYLNDDFFFGRPVDPDLFFDLTTGRPRVFTSSAPIPAGAAGAVGMYAAALRSDEIVRRLTGQGAPRLLAHAPYPQRLSLIRELESRVPEEFEQTRLHRFRHPDDVSVPASLAPWYALANGVAVESDLAYEYVSVGHPTTGARLRRLYRYRRFDTFCVNWTERTPERWDGHVRRFLERRFPVPAPWERSA